jgi:hypothetical protein
MVLKPKFKHDCTKCKFIGWVQVDGKVADLYRQCGTRKYDEGFILRFSSEGNDYIVVDQKRLIYKIT